MGLDQTLIAVTDENDLLDKTGTLKIGWWRKNEDLHNLMQKLYHAKGGTGAFNDTHVELNGDDLQVTKKLCASLSDWKGSRKRDKEILERAEREMKAGKKIFYFCSW